MKKSMKTPRWIETKRMRKAAKRKGQKTLKAHATQLIKISK